MKNDLDESIQRRWEMAWRESDEPLAPRWHRQTSRLTWGLVTAVPLILTLSMLASENPRTTVGLGLLTVLWTGFAVITMSVFVARSKRLPALAKINWGFAFLFAAPLMLPVFWLRHIWDAPMLHMPRVQPVFVEQSISSRRQPASTRRSLRH